MAEEKKPERGVTRWDPFLELFESRPGRLSRLFEELREDWPRGIGLRPATDISEDDGSYTVSVELPGSRKDDVTVELHDGVLTIRGEKKSEREEKKEHSRYVERRYGSFSRSFTLPSNADPDQIHASFKDGVLTVSIAKREQEKPRTISVKA